jgi:hypothetical protein
MVAGSGLPLLKKMDTGFLIAEIEHLVFLTDGHTNTTMGLFRMVKRLIISAAIALVLIQNTLRPLITPQISDAA